MYAISFKVTFSNGKNVNFSRLHETNFTIISINEVYFIARTNKADEHNGCVFAAHLKERTGMVDTDDKNAIHA